MSPASTFALAAALCLAVACRGGTEPSARSDRAAKATPPDRAVGSLSGSLVTNAGQLDARLVPLRQAEVIVVRVGDLLPPSDSLRNPADGDGGPFEFCGGVSNEAVRTRSAADGTFAIGGLAPGSYDVMIVAQAGWGFTAYCAYQIRGGVDSRVTIYVPPGQLSG
jgi:hypothetical protein